MNAAIRGLALGVAPASDRQTVGDFLSTWIEGQTSIRPTTMRRYRSLVKYRLFPADRSGEDPPTYLDNYLEVSGSGFAETVCSQRGQEYNRGCNGAK